MRLKEITPGMVIHCKNDEEKKVLLEEAERLGYLWYVGKQKPTERLIKDTGNTIHFYDAGQSCFAKDYKHITHSGKIGGNVTEFSDLILPELTAEEALRIKNKICDKQNSCAKCPLSECCKELGKEKEILKVLEQWKADHEKKSPEIETVDICRIIEIQPDGRKRCVHEEDIKPDPELPYGSEEIAVHEILKRYCMEHDGEFIAVHEVVSRVKK